MGRSEGIGLLTLRLMPWSLSIARLAPGSGHDWALKSRFYSVSQSAEELSVVCESALVPVDVQQTSGWRALKIASVLDFSLVGIIAQLSAALAEAGISIFVISTYDTDYILVKAADSEHALETLRQNGYDIIP